MRRSSLLVVLLTMLFSVGVLAQTVTTGEVTGTAADITGAVVTGASIVLKSVDTGESRRVVSNAAGLYRFTFVRPGMYDLSASAERLRSDTSRIEVPLGRVRTVNPVLKVEEQRRTVSVTDVAPLLDSDNGQITYTLSQRQLDLLPMPGGDLTSVAYSVPGVVLNNRVASNVSGNFAIQGIGALSSLFTLNGADDMDPYWNVHNSGVTGLLLGANEIQEASVIQNAYEGQYGRQAGAQVNYVSKSGSNNFHGNLAYTYNGNFLNAKDYFTPPGTPTGHTVSNQYAAAFGGPVIRGKLFFFVDTEGLRYALPGGTTVVSVPSHALEQYSLNTIRPEQAAFYQRVFSFDDKATGRTAAVPVTNGSGLLQDRSGRLGCGRFSGTPTGFGGTFGKDVSCSDAYARGFANNTSEWLASVRMDYNLSDRQRMFFRVKTDHGLQDSTNPISSLFDVVSDQPNYEAQLNHAFQLTPRLANNLIATLSDYNHVSSFPNASATLAALSFRINVPEGGANGGGMAPVGPNPNFPSGNRSVNLQFVDDVSYNVGLHWLKAGVNYRYTRESDVNFAAFSQVGRFNLSLSDFAHGVVSPTSRYRQVFPAAPILHSRLYNFGFYLQDQWAVTQHLKLSATLRFDRNGNPDCLEHCFARFVSPFSEIAKGAAIPYNQSIQSGLAHPFQNMEPVVVQPRFSFAYSPAWAKGTVIRGGVGMFSDLYSISFASLTLGQNAPSYFNTFFGGGLVNSGGAGSAPAIAAASANAFKSQFAGGATLAQLQNAVAPASFAAPNFYSIPSTLKTPKVAEWDLEVQHQIGTRNLASLRYSGNLGYDIFLQNGTVNAATNTAAYPNGFAGLPLTPPDPRFGGITQVSNAGVSNYNGLTASLRRSLSSRLQGQISYTWSHALDVVSNGGLDQFADVSLQGQIDPSSAGQLNYSSSDYDVRHNLTLDFIWDLPGHLQRRPLRMLLTGWSIASRAQANSGTPFSVVNSDLTNTAAINLDGRPAVPAALADPRANRTCGHSALLTPCFTAAQFATTATQASFGNIPRNSFRGPGYVNVDSSLYKTVSVTERAHLTLGVTAFNLLNHTNLQDPNADVSSSGFGLITFTNDGVSTPYGYLGAAPSRTVVLTGKLRF